MRSFPLWMAIGLLGAAGAVARYAICQMTSHWSVHFPWGTFIVNVSGCFLLGAAAYAARVESPAITPFMRSAIAVGFLGGLTTFSAFSLETVDRANHGMWSMAGINVVANLAVGLAAIVLGQVVARMAL